MGLAGPGSHWVGGGVGRACHAEEGTLDQSQWEVAPRLGYNLKCDPSPPWALDLPFDK